MKLLLPFTLSFLLFIYLTNGQKIDPTELKCLVCEKALEEVQTLLSKVDPDIKVDVGGYRLDSDGNMQRKKISQANSEVFLSDMLEKVCSKMDDYVRARWKSSGELTLLKLISADGKMNSDMGNVDIVQDGDLNRSLQYYCEILLEENEEAIIENLSKNMDNIDIRVCSMAAGYCNKKLPQDEL